MFGNRLNKLFCCLGSLFFVCIIVCVMYICCAYLLCGDKFFGLSSTLIIADFNMINMFILIVSFYKVLLINSLKYRHFFCICLRINRVICIILIVIYLYRALFVWCSSVGFNVAWRQMFTFV